MIRRSLIALTLVGLGWVAARAQTPATPDFELRVTTTQDGNTRIECVRGCGLQLVDWYVANRDGREERRIVRVPQRLGQIAERLPIRPHRRMDQPLVGCVFSAKYAATLQRDKQYLASLRGPCCPDKAKDLPQC